MGYMRHHGSLKLVVLTTKSYVCVQPFLVLNDLKQI